MNFNKNNEERLLYIRSLIKKRYFVVGEGDYIVYDIKENGDLVVVFTMGPVSSLSSKEQLKRLKELSKHENIVDKLKLTKEA